MRLNLTILGEPASKANSRQFLFLGGRLRSVKSDKAINFVSSFVVQVKTNAKGWYSEKHLSFSADIYYASHRPDLDESLIMDALQKAGVIKNDRQIVWKRDIRYFIDKLNPRSDIILEEIEWDFTNKGAD